MFVLVAGFGAGSKTAGEKDRSKGGYASDEYSSRHLADVYHSGFQETICEAFLVTLEKLYNAPKVDASNPAM